MSKFKLVIIITTVAVVIIGCSRSVLTFNDELLVKSTIIGTNIINGHEHSEYYKNGYDNYIAGEYDKAASNLERAIELYQSNEEKISELEDIQYFLARSYYFLGEYNSSLDLSEQSIELNEQINNTYVMNCINIGENYYALENYEDALKYYVMAENNCDKINENSYYDTVDVFTAILKIYQETENADMMLEYARKIDDYKGTVVDLDKYNKNIMYTYDAMITLYTQTGEYEKAIEILTKAKDFCIKNKDYDYAALMLYCKSELYFEMGDTEKGTSIAQEGIELCNQQLKIYDDAELSDMKNVLESKLM